MKPKDIIFPLAPLYKKKNIDFIQAKAITFHPEGDAEIDKGYIIAEYVTEDRKGEQIKVDYDYLINATGPRLAFDQTEGLIPGKMKCTQFVHTIMLNMQQKVSIN